MDKDDRAKFEALHRYLSDEIHDGTPNQRAVAQTALKLLDAALASAQAASAEPVATWDRLAAAGRVDTLPFRVPGTMRTEKVECVILTRSDVAGLATRTPEPQADKES